MPHDPNELIAVVNKDDRVIGRATRKEIHAKGLLHREASVLLVNSKNEILLQKRKDNGFLDYSASGHFLHNQDYLTAAIRETDEELGLKIPRNKFLEICKRKLTGKELKPKNNRFVCLFEVKGDYKIKEMKIDKAEVSSIKFYSIDELKRIIKNKNGGYGFIEMLKIYVDKHENQFNDLLFSAKDRIIKLELLDSYADAFKEEKRMTEYFLKHGKLSPELKSEIFKEWYVGTKKLYEKGVKFIRIHVVTLPISDYIRFEIESYKISEKYGETIYMIDRKDFNRIKPEGKINILDFLVFDKNTIAFVNFKVDKKHNAKKHTGITYVTDRKLAVKYVNYWESLLKKSIPLRKFVKEKVK